jgi:hypothetical protein
MSDPSALQIPLNQALTSDMLLGLKPSAPKSRSYRINIAPINKNVFTPLDQIVFELPTGRRGSWLDQSQSYLKFSVQFASTSVALSTGGVTNNFNTGNNGIYLDNTAYSFFQRLDIYHASNLLESINEYGQLANFLIDTSLTQSDKAGLSTLIGCNGVHNMVTSVNVGPPTQNSALNGNITVLQSPGDRSGQSVTSVSIASGISTAIPYTYSLPLLSGVIGCNASKMIPVGKLNSPIRVELYLSSLDDAVYYGAKGAGCQWQIINVEFCACYVELQDDNLDLQLAPDQSEYISTTTYRQSSSNLPAATSGEYTVLLPFRAASINSLYARFRNFASATQGSDNSAAYRKSSSINPNFSNVYFRVGSSIYPNKPIYLINGSIVGTGAEAYAELLKSFHALSSSIGNSALPFSSYNVCASPQQGWVQNFVPIDKRMTTPAAGANVYGVATVDTHANAFALGLELQSFSNRNDTILSGISTLNTQIYFTATIVSGATSGGTNSYNYTCDYFAQMDMILVLQNGVLSAKF